MEELSKAEIPLVRKRKRLMRDGDIVQARNNVSANEAIPTRERSGQAEQKEEETVAGEGVVAREGSRAREGDEKRQVLPLVVMPFEPALGEDLAAQIRQADKVKRAQALSDA